MIDLHAALILNASQAYIHSLGAATPAAKNIYNLMSNPRPGDLVYEHSTSRVDSLGYLICVRPEFAPLDDGNYWYILTLDGEFVKWYNCQFLRILEAPEWQLRESDPSREEWAAALAEHYFTTDPLEVNPFPDSEIMGI